MNGRKIVGSLMLFLLLCLLAGMVFAQGTPIISRWVIGGRGSTTATGGNVSLRSALGQAVAGSSRSGDVTLQSGFWSGGLPPHIVFLSVVLQDYVSYFEGPWEKEPNNSYLQANGALRSDRDYHGYPDEKDYFSVYLRTGGTLTVDLTNHAGHGVQLQLFYESVSNRVRFVPDPPYHTEYTGSGGWYYIYIYTKSWDDGARAYTLRVTYP